MTMNPLEAHFPADKRRTLGIHRFEAEAIIAFARKFDPQRFHVDAEAARDSLFGALCASGWHTTAVWMKNNVADYPRQSAEWKAAGLTIPHFGPSPGVRNLRWPRPVYAGDTITFFATPVSCRPIAKRPGWYMLDHVGEAENQSGASVLRFEGAVLVRP